MYFCGNISFYYYVTPMPSMFIPPALTISIPPFRRSSQTIPSPTELLMNCINLTKDCIIKFAVMRG